MVKRNLFHKTVKNLWKSLSVWDNKWGLLSQSPLACWLVYLTWLHYCKTHYLSSAFAFLVSTMSTGKTYKLNKSLGCPEVEWTIFELLYCERQSQDSVISEWWLSTRKPKYIFVSLKQSIRLFCCCCCCYCCAAENRTSIVLSFILLYYF